jgi:hypothetical protein
LFGDITEHRRRATSENLLPTFVGQSWNRDEYHCESRLMRQKAYVDLAKGEKVPNQGIGAILKATDGKFYEITAETWIKRCDCILPNCRGGKRVYQVRPVAQPKGK